MHNIERRIHAVQIRQQRQWLWQCASRGLFAGGIFGCLIAMIRIATEGAFSWVWVVAAVTVPVAAGVIVAMFRSKSLLCAARLIDSRCNLKDRAQTALQFRHSEGSSWHRLQVADAETHLQSMDPAKVSPIHAPKSWVWGVMTSTVAVLLALLTGAHESLVASVVTNSVVAQVASRTAEDMKELEQFQKEQNDPELDMLLKEMNEQLKQLSEPGVDPKEALAKLSELDAAMQDMQKQLSASGAETQLKEIGEALSLSESMSAAGKAMSKGDLQTAAQELDNAELPQLDRKTERAIAEQLEQVQKNVGDRNQKQASLKKALDKMLEGISSKDKSKFSEGAKGLASECRKQEQKNKLADLLRKQSQFLAESRSQCESESRNMAQGGRKGGQKAGKGTAGDQAGEKTAKLKTGQEMKLQGQDSGDGDAELETTTNPEQEQAAVRQYRQNADKYEALSESVLESESIPLGHRQTIRRYFELIRPQGHETDAVNSKTAE